MSIATLIIIGLIGGIAVGLQSPMASAIGQRVGGTASSFIVHLSGAIFSGTYLLLKGGENIRDWTKLPWYMLCSGIFGLILYITIYYTMPRLGALTTVTLIIIGQLIVGIIIDNFGWLNVAVHPLTLARVAGVALLIAGGYLIAK